MNDQLTFNGFPVTIEMVGEEAYITCKGVTATLEQGHKFMNKQGTEKCFFGQCRIRSYPHRMVKIDCLMDTLDNFTHIYNEAIKIKEEHVQIIQKERKNNGRNITKN
jgi:hypothetical protein